MNNIIRRLIQDVLSTYTFKQLRKPKKAKDGKVHLPASFAALGSVVAVLFLIPTFITAFFDDEETWVTILFFVFSIIGVVLVIAFINCRISYDDDGFVAKTFFGVKRKATYDQVTAIKENMHETYIYIGKRRVMVDEYSIGGMEFIKLVKKKYRTFNNGKSIPQIQKSKYDIFNGHIEDVTGFYAAYIIIFVVLIGMIILLTCYTFTSSSVNNTIEQTVIFNSCEIVKDEIILTATDNQIYKITFNDEQINIQEIKTICNGKSEVTTYSKEVTPDDEEDYYSVKAIKNKDDYLLSFEETNKLNRLEGLKVIGLFLFMLLIWNAYIVASIVVGRNPQKFSKKVVRLFFKDGYINY